MFDIDYDKLVISLLTIIACGSIGNLIINFYAVTRPRNMSDAELTHQIKLAQVLHDDKRDSELSTMAQEKYDYHSYVAFAMSPPYKWDENFVETNGGKHD